MNGDSDKNYFEALEAAEKAGQSGKAQPWERQLGETSKSFAAFQKYLNLSSRRTLGRVAEMSGCSAQNIERWSRKWSWVARVQAYDVIEEQKFREQTCRDRLAHSRRQIAIGQSLQSVAVAGVRELQDRLTQKLPLNLTPIELAALLKLGDELESRGLGTSREGRFTRINVILKRQADYPEPMVDDKSTPLIEGEVPKFKPN